MNFTAQEIALCNFALRTLPETNRDGQFMPRQLATDELEDGVSISKKIKSCVKDDKIVDSDVEFSTTEKAFLLKLIERPWGVDDAEIKISLKGKLI